MAWLFGRRHKAANRELLHRCQRLFAHQQHAVEVFNDAVTQASGMPLGSGYVEAFGANLTSPSLVEMYLLPAMAKKQEILQAMRLEYEGRIPSSDPDERRIRTAIEQLLGALEARADDQMLGLERWVLDPGFNPPELVTETEMAATLEAVRTVQSAFAKSGIYAKEFVAINVRAINEIRLESGLRALPEDQLAELCVAAFSGTPARLFADESQESIP